MFKVLPKIVADLRAISPVKIKRVKVSNLNSIILLFFAGLYINLIITAVHKPHTSY